MRELWLPGFLLLLAVPHLRSQTLHLSPIAASRGETITLELSWNSTHSAGPVAMQWETRIPTAALSLIEREVSPGPAAREAGKSVACAVKGKPGPNTTTVLCLLAGGQAEIHSGVVAHVRIQVLPQARIGSARIRLDQGIAVAFGLQETRIEPSEAIIAVRAK